MKEYILKFRGSGHEDSEINVDNAIIIMIVI